MFLPLFLVPILTGLIAQALKPLFNKKRRAEELAADRKLPRYGGMPSAHTAFASSLATVVAIVEGIGSVSFTITAALVIFILDDALRMRIFLGRQGQALHRLIIKLPVEEREQYPRLETHLGHKPMEVVVGAVLGVVLTLVFMFFLWVS